MSGIGPIGASPAAGAPARAGAPPPERSFGEVLGEVADPRARAPDASLAPPGTAAGPARVAPPAARDGPAQLRRVLVSLAEGERKLDGVIRSALAGRDYSPQELIALQATVLRHSQEVEVVSRVLDRLTGAVKTTLQTQV